MADELAVARLQLIIFSAQGLKDVRLLGRTRTSVLAWVDPTLKQATAAHRATTRNPIWNQTLTIPLSAATLSDPSSTITLQLLCCRTASTAAVPSALSATTAASSPSPSSGPPGGVGVSSPSPRISSPTGASPEFRWRADRRWSGCPGFLLFNS